MSASLQHLDATAFELLDKNTEEFASTDEKLANNKEDIEDTKKSLAADEEFLAMLKEKCSDTDVEWEERQHPEKYKAMA